MRRKGLAAVSMAAVLSMSMLLGGCGDKEAVSGSLAVQDTQASTEETQKSGEVNMWDGYYQDTSTGRLSFTHFYEDGTYYSKYFEGSFLDAGTYQVLEEELEYSVDGGADGDFNTVEDNKKTTAPKVVEMTSYKSGAPVKVAFDNDSLCDMSLAGVANHRTMTHDPEYAYNPATDEIAIDLFVFFAGNSVGSSFTLSHNKTFVDVTGDSFLEGTWDMKEAGVYELVYSDGVKGTLKVEEDGKKAVLEKDGAQALDMKDNFEDEPDLSDQVVLSLSAQDAQVGLPMGVGLRMDCYGDGTCKLIVEVAQVGAELEADTGTYTVSEAYKYTFNFEKAGEVAGEPDYATASESGLDVTAAYKADVTVEFNGSETALSIDSELKGTYVPGGAAKEAEVVTSLTAQDAQVGLPMGVDLRLDCYDDGSCKLMVVVEQVGAELEADKGTYSVSETYRYTFQFDTAGEVVAEPDYANATEAGMDMTAAYKADVEVEFNGAKTPLSIDSELLGKVTP